jgi:hypothetical protein
MLDRDLAGLYEVTTGNLNLAVRRNLQRFPEDSMFRLTENEHLILQSAIPNSVRGGSRYPPFAFTEHGVAMLSSVLHSERAVQMNILIIRAFMKLRALVAGQTALARRLEKLEATQKGPRRSPLNRREGHRSAGKERRQADPQPRKPAPPQARTNRVRDVEVPLKRKDYRRFLRVPSASSAPPR